MTCILCGHPSIQSGICTRCKTRLSNQLSEEKDRYSKRFSRREKKLIKRKRISRSSSSSTVNSVFLGYDAILTKDSDTGLKVFDYYWNPSTLEITEVSRLGIDMVGTANTKTEAVKWAEDKKLIKPG